MNTFELSTHSDKTPLAQLSVAALLNLSGTAERQFGVLMLPWRMPLMALLAGFPFGIAELCLSDGIPASDRRFVVNSAGQDSNIRMSIFSWTSAELVSTIAQLLIEEVLGVHVRTEVSSGALEGVEALLHLSGCSDLECSSSSDESSDVALEFWLADSAEEVSRLKASSPSRAPEDLGSIGYPSMEGLFVTASVLDEAYEDSGHALDYYRSYNKTHNRPMKFFAPLADLDLTDFVACNESKWVDPSFINPYVQWTGDLQGVEASDGGYHAFCPNGRFWIAPACRGNTSECIPIISTGYGWGVHFIMQWSAVYGLPVAVGIAKSWAQYVAIVKSMNVLFYWWLPDATFAALEPKLLMLPEHDPSQWSLGNQRTATAGGYIGKFVSQGLQRKSPVVFGLLESFRMASLSAMQEMLLKLAKGEEMRQVACEWLLSNRQIWETWIPRNRKTSCPPGRGMVNLEGEFVGSRENAVDCGFCPPGRFSESITDGIGTSHRCALCESGTYQNLYAEGTCKECELGQFSATNGSFACEMCSLGSYANSTGLTACTKCGDESQWTTSQVVMDKGISKWIELEGATSSDFCGCRAGWFLFLGSCQSCIEGSTCPGSSQLELLPGYHSRPDDPRHIFQCYGATALRCPGGAAGSCAAGRDANSVTCAACLPGLVEDGGPCRSCQGKDYLMSILIALLLVASTSALHIVNLRMERRGRTASVVNVIVPLSQMVTCVQLCTVMTQISIRWTDPFTLLLDALSYVSLDELAHAFTALNCVADATPTLRFLFTNVMLPTALVLPPAILHLAYAKVTGKAWKMHVLGETLLGLYAVLIITQVNSAVGPFRCSPHPNGLWTMQGYHAVVCDFAAQHLQLCLLGVAIGLIPLGFLTLCSWMLLIELPKRVNSGDVTFVRSCRFLIFRFHPGYEVFALILLARNILFACAPMLPWPSVSVVIMQSLLGCSIALTTYFKPWKTRAATVIDIVVNASLQSVLLVGSFFMPSIDPSASMALCTCVVALLLFGLLMCAAVGVAKQLMGCWLKSYRFFLCHHKASAGCLSRLLKMELTGQGANHKVFVDTDNLTDLTRLFTVVSNEVDMLVVVGTPPVLTRKWCLGEITTARLNNVPAVVLGLAGFELPNHCLDVHLGLVNISDLANYGISMEDLKDTINWLRTVKCFRLEDFSLSALQSIVEELKGVKTAVSPAAYLTDSADSDCLILSDSSNTEAMATAYILAAMTSQQIMHTQQTLPRVVMKGEKLPAVAVEHGAGGACSCLLVCTQLCFHSKQMADWLLQAYRLECRVLPIVASEDFELPSVNMGHSLQSVLGHSIDVTLYLTILRSLFLEITLPFLPQKSSEEDLKWKARRIVQRLEDGDVPDLATRCVDTQRSTFDRRVVQGLEAIEAMEHEEMTEMVF
eukprot:s1980_g6.t1